MKKPNKKDSKYRLLGFFFYWRAYKKDLQLYNDLLYYNPPKLKKKVVKNVIDVKHVKPEIDVRKESFSSLLNKWVDDLFEPVKNIQNSWIKEQEEKIRAEQYSHHTSTQNYLEHMAKYSTGVPSSYEGRFEESRRSGKTTRQVDEVIQKLFERRGERVAIAFQSMSEARHFEQILKTRMRQEHGVAVEVQYSNSHHYHRPGHFITLTVREKGSYPGQYSSFNSHDVQHAANSIISSDSYVKAFNSKVEAEHFYKEVEYCLREVYGRDGCHHKFISYELGYRLELKAH